MVNENLGQFDFNVEKLAFDLAMSRQNLNAKIKKLTGLTVSQYIQEARLVSVRKVLETRKAASVKAAVLGVGIKDVKYFSKKFKDRFGKSPSAYL
jgi:AraC-like DNA-binding protein